MSSIFRTYERIQKNTQSKYHRTSLQTQGVKEVKVYKKGKPVMTKVPIQQPYRKQDK